MQEHGLRLVGQRRQWPVVTVLEARGRLLVHLFAITAMLVLIHLLSLRDHKARVLLALTKRGRVLDPAIVRTALKASAE